MSDTKITKAEAAHELAAIARWILRDAIYKAPEQIDAEFVEHRYLNPLREKLMAYEAAE